MTKFEQDCEEYKKELESYLAIRRITINEYCNELDEAFILDVLFPKSNTELMYAKKAFEIFKAIRSETVEGSKCYEDNVAYQMSLTAIKGLKDRSQYKILEQAFEMIEVNQDANCMYMLDMMKLAENDAAIESIVREVISASSSREEAERMLEIYKRNLVMAQLKALQKISKKNPVLLSLKAFNIESIDKLPSIRRYATENHQLYEYIMSKNMSENPSSMKLEQ